MSNTLPPVTATRPERTPIGDVFADRVELLMDKLDSARARLDEAAERIDETWMAELDATVEAEHAKVADEIAAKVVEDLAATPLEIDIPGYHDEPTEADLEEERERAEGAMAVLTTWEPTAEELEQFEADLLAAQQHAGKVTVLDPETYESDDDGRGNEPPLSDVMKASIARGIAEAGAGLARPLPWVTKGLTPEPTEAELAEYEAAKVAEQEGHRFQLTKGEPPKRIGPALTDAEATQRLRAPRKRKPSPAPREDGEK